MAHIFWDTNIFIYLLEDSPQFGQAAEDLRREMLERDDRLITSAMTVSEVLVKPTSVGDTKLAARYKAFFASPQVTGSSFDLAAADAYATIRQDRTISPPDAIQLACAAAADVDLFITNDNRLKHKVIPGIKFISSLSEAPL